MVGMLQAHGSIGSSLGGILIVVVCLGWLGHGGGIGVSRVQQLRGLLLGVLWFQGWGAIVWG